ncbi:HAD-IIIA family hydrolase [Paludibacterium paludis]|uniref:Haloacid dehalogenase n=1 Tax=Paludibacterium paludis TaxID=1225769 RepID=A0A918P4T5_9NEIS|nr:HAD-IIIA family hydrolase [Paludibacterium paludis]GGY22990.1 haloacid dehalogenase [Paludibacterium paludis]
MALPFDLIVFDWDGTLMDSTAHIVHSIQNAARDVGAAIPDRAAASHVIGLGLAEALQKACPDLPPERYPAMVDAYRRYYFSADETIELFPGVSEAMRALAQQGYLLAVATGKSRRGLDRALTATGLADCFDATRTVDECPSKPHPAMLEALMEQLGATPTRTLMVGDTTHDLLMAANAGTHGAGLTQGAHDADILELCPSLGVFDTFADFYGWLSDYRT